MPSHMPGSLAQMEMENRLMVAQANEAKSIAQYRVPSRVGWTSSESLTPLKAEYIGADQLPFFVFRLQLCGEPYIAVMPFRWTWPGFHCVKIGCKIALLPRLA